MKISYDSEVDALSIVFRDTTVTSKHLAEGIAARPSDIDLVLVNGYGFPSSRGGPMHYADSIGLSRVRATAQETASRDGLGFEVAPLLVLLESERRSFSSLNTKTH